MALSGISALLNVTAAKSDNANQDAIKGASQQTATRQALHQALLTAPVSLDSLKTIKGKLDQASKDLESQDKLGNFEIQDLMSRYNQTETLASSVLKKQQDTDNSVISKLG